MFLTQNLIFSAFLKEEQNQKRISNTICDFRFLFIFEFFAADEKHVRYQTIGITFRKLRG